MIETAARSLLPVALVLATSSCVSRCPESYSGTEEGIVDELEFTVFSEGFMEDWEPSSILHHPYVRISFQPGGEASLGMTLENPDCEAAQIGFTIFSDSAGDIDFVRLRYDYRQCSSDPTLQNYMTVEELDVDCPMTITPLVMGESLTGLRYEFDGCTLDILDDPPAAGPSVSGLEIDGTLEVPVQRQPCK